MAQESVWHILLKTLGKNKSKIEWLPSGREASARSTLLGNKFTCDPV